MVQTQFTTTFHLAAGIDETSVAHWFVGEGERVRGSAPLVTLHHQTGAAFTLRTPSASLLNGATIQRILLHEGSSVSASDVLAVLTKTTIEAGRAIEQVGVGAREPEESATCAEMGVDLVFTSSSLARDLLFERFPRFRRFYFRTYPLLPLLDLGCFTIIAILSALWLNRQFAHLSGTPASPGQGGWSLLIALASFIPVAIGILAAVALIALRQFSLRRLYRKHRSARPGR